MIPETEAELEKWMIDNCYNFNEYSINGNHIWEGFGIEKKSDLFYWYFSERGRREILKIFGTEKEIIEYAYNHIKSNKTSKSHCIGFLFDKNKSDELKQILDEMNIKFEQDQVPYFKDEKQIAYRTFVFGCDIEKVDYLRKKYLQQ